MLVSAGGGVPLVQRAGSAALATGELRHLAPPAVLGRGVPVLGDPRRRRPYGTVGVLASVASRAASDPSAASSSGRRWGGGRGARAGAVRGDGGAAGPRGRAGSVGGPGRRAA
ncbi:hypothetical protein ACFWGM_35210 [Streptomyces roseolus]|uniref:hypothetical protein n=1 Tax=Streptomyces roseolus TaxID=67358 RepID=UPI00363C9B11